MHIPHTLKQDTFTLKTRWNLHTYRTIDTFTHTNTHTHTHMKQ
jgi:hypothetical protein